MQNQPRFSKRAIALGATFGVVVALTVTAFAYWTTTGEGVGEATTGTSVEFEVESDAATGPALTPDAAIGNGNIQTVAYTVTNPAGAGSQQLNQVVIKIAEADGSTWDDVPGCTAQDYSVGESAVGTDYTDTTGLPTVLTEGQVYSSTVTVQMIDDNTNQNACKDAVVPLYFAAS